MKVQKFGGTSVGSAARIKNVADIVYNTDDQSIVVLSAMSGTTNALVEINDCIKDRKRAKAKALVNALRTKYANEISELMCDAPFEALANVKADVDCVLDFIAKHIEAPKFTKNDALEIIVCGEYMSTAMMFGYMKSLGYDVVMIPALDFMRVDRNGEPDMKTTGAILNRLLEKVGKHQIYITQGFVCRDNKDGFITNLKRGGSDYTATIIGNLVNADEVLIWTDIDGLHNNDPRVVAETTRIDHIGYRQAIDLANYGAKILHPDCIIPAMDADIPVRLLNTFDPSAPGTLISGEEMPRDAFAVAAKDSISALHIESNSKISAQEIFYRQPVYLSYLDFRIDMLSATDRGISLALPADMLSSYFISEFTQYTNVTRTDDLAIVCIVGGFRRNTELSLNILFLLHDIKIHMISYSADSLSILVLIDAADKDKALRQLNNLYRF